MPGHGSSRDTSRIGAAARRRSFRDLADASILSAIWFAIFHAFRAGPMPTLKISICFFFLLFSYVILFFHAHSIDVIQAKNPKTTYRSTRCRLPYFSQQVPRASQLRRGRDIRDSGFLVPCYNGQHCSSSSHRVHIFWERRIKVISFCFFRANSVEAPVTALHPS